MPLVDRNGFRINYEITCENDGPTLLLVAGLGEQIGSVEYPEEHCEVLSDQGFRVVRMDNRDAGLSLPTGDEGAISQYSMLDLADDTWAVIKDLNSGPVHLVGASMGGFIARWAALRCPHRIASLTVVMSGSGAGPDDDGPQPDQQALPSLLGMMERRERAEQIDWSTENWRWLWGNKYPFPSDWIGQRVANSYDRSYRPEGVARLLKASRSTPGLWEEQARIDCPTLVMHGGEDPVFSSEHGTFIAERIPNSTLWLDPNMGHTMHEEQWAEMAIRIAAMTE